MKRTNREIGLSDLRADLGQFVDRAAAGEEIVITDRGRPVARLAPIKDPFDDLVAAGLVRVATNPSVKPKDLGLPIKVKGTVSDLIRR